jgi:hypothetical protein
MIFSENFLSVEIFLEWKWSFPEHWSGTNDFDAKENTTLRSGPVLKGGITTPSPQSSGSRQNMDLDEKNK